MTTTQQRVELAGLAVTPFSVAGLIDRLVELAGRPAGGPVATACYINAHIFNLAWADAGVHETLARATLLWPDGVSGRGAMLLAGANAPQRLSGFYFFDELNRRLAAAGLRQFLLGARPEVMARAADAVERRHPSLVAGWHDGHFPPDRDDEVIEKINASNADVLTVGMGSPRQEQWIVRHAGRLRPRLAWTVGALFDFISGTEHVAPRWMRTAGLEWAWRLSQDFGGKWRRYLLGNPLFVWRVLRRRPRIIR
ncbi:MAG: WecB/TagA/CpsF family glycosyltransferase [Phycisphaerae bacterium]|nr:WecB/TagA/CpsF family glycosyltransferase [Phycisphaerae bacterium]